MSMKKYVIFFVMQLFFARGLDLNWIPSDPNAASLPLSSAYREALRPLCDIIKKKQTKLPADVELKRPTIEKMCQKLASDDMVSPPGGASALRGFPRWGLPLCALAGACYWGYTRGMAQKTPRVSSTAAAGDISKAREARLKRFKDM